LDVVTALADAIAAIEDEPCSGKALRGSGTRGYCEYRLTRRRRSWRILYQVRGAEKTPYLLTFGEHYLPVEVKSFRPPARRVPQRLGAELGFDDVYVSLVRLLGLDETQIREMVRAVRGGALQRPCC